MFSLLGAQQSRSDPGSLVSGLRNGEMLSSDHAHSIDRTCHQTESQHGLTLHWPKRLQEGESQGPIWLIRFKSWLGQNKVCSYALEEMHARACHLGAGMWLSVECLPTCARPWLYFITVEKRKDRKIKPKRSIELNGNIS